MMDITILVLAILMVAIILGLLSIKYYNAKQIPLCHASSNGEEKQCRTCGVYRVEDCEEAEKK